MARKYTSGSLGAWYRSKMTKIQDGVDDAMEDAGKEGEELMKHYIETRGTGRTWTSARNGREGSYPGRVDSGRMRDAVGHRTTTQGGSRQLRIGWVSGTRDEYFILQDIGFQNAGIAVPGMFALQDATDHALTQLMNNIKREVNDA